MNFNDETKVKDIALSNPAARQILEDAGLDYCCGGGQSLHEACLHVDVPAEEILNRLRKNSKHVRPDEANWTLAPLVDSVPGVEGVRSGPSAACASRKQHPLPPFSGDGNCGHPKEGMVPCRFHWKHQ